MIEDQRSIKLGHRVVVPRDLTTIMQEYRKWFRYKELSPQPLDIITINGYGGEWLVHSSRADLENRRCGCQLQAVQHDTDPMVLGEDKTLMIFWDKERNADPVVNLSVPFDDVKIVGQVLRVVSYERVTGDL